MNPLDTLIRDYVTPIMRDSGFRKSGRTFRLVGERGDQVLLRFSIYVSDPELTVFNVDVFVIPAPYWDWLTRNQPSPRSPDTSGSLVACQVIPPLQAAHEPHEELPFRASWGFNSEQSAEVCGSALRRMLIEETIPQMLYLIDRGNLLEEERKLDFSMMKHMTPAMREIIFRIDDAPIEDMNRLLEAAKKSGALRSFIELNGLTNVSRRAIRCEPA